METTMVAIAKPLHNLPVMVLSVGTATRWLLQIKAFQTDWVVAVSWLCPPTSFRRSCPSCVRLYEQLPRDAASRPFLPLQAMVALAVLLHQTPRMRTLPTAVESTPPTVKNEFLTAVALDTKGSMMRLVCIMLYETASETVTSGMAMILTMAPSTNRTGRDMALTAELRIH